MIQHLWSSSSSLLVNGTLSSVTVVSTGSPSSSNSIAAPGVTPSPTATNPASGSATNATGAPPPAPGVGATGTTAAGVGPGVGTGSVGPGVGVGSVGPGVGVGSVGPGVGVGSVGPGVGVGSVGPGVGVGAGSSALWKRRKGRYGRVFASGIGGGDGEPCHEADGSGIYHGTGGGGSIMAFSETIRIRSTKCSPSRRVPWRGYSCRQ